MTHPHLRPSLREIVGMVCWGILVVALAVAAGLFAGIGVATLTGFDAAGYVAWVVTTVIILGLFWGTTA